MVAAFRCHVFALGLIVGFILSSCLRYMRPPPLPPRPTTLRSIRNGGDLTEPATLRRMLSFRGSSTHEVIFMLTDIHHVRLALSLLINLDELGLHHHLGVPIVC